jgi:hypothetical protein
VPRPVRCVDDAGAQPLAAVLSQDLNGLVEAESRQADFNDRLSLGFSSSLSMR